MNIVIVITLVSIILLVLILLIPSSNKQSEKSIKEPILNKNIPNILGASHFKLRHKVTTDDTTQKDDNQLVKDNIFVSSEFFVEDNQPLDIDFPLEKEEEMDEVDLAEEEEELEALFGKDAELASGVEFDDLFRTTKVIENINSTTEEEHIAGKVLYENQHALLFEELVSKQKITGSRIASLVDIHLAKLNEANNIPQQNALTENSDSYEKFNINDFIN